MTVKEIKNIYTGKVMVMMLASEVAKGNITLEEAQEALPSNLQNIFMARVKKSKAILDESYTRPSQWATEPTQNMLGKKRSK